MSSILISIVYVLVSCLMLFGAKVLFDKIAPYDIEEQIKDKNYTPIIALCGYLIGITLILVGAFVGPATKSIKMDFVMYVLYALAGIGLMNLSSFIASKVMLSKFNNTDELIKDKNIGTAAVHFGVYLATGMIIATCINGEYGGLISSVVYYILGMAFLFIFLKIYDLITPYSIHDELEKDNYAVGIALAGNIIAIGLILAKATLGDTSTDWVRNLILYFIDLTAIVFLLPGVRFVLGNVIVKNIKLNKELQENNVAAGLVEFVGIICFAVILFFTVDFSVII